MAHSQSKNYRWPDIFQPALRGGIPYAQMLTAYKRYKVFLNINSVASSPTMFARRVFELLACGTPVVSSYSEGIEALFGTDLVLMSKDERTTRRHLERLLGDDDYRDRLALRGQRKVFAEHTYTHRLQTILSTIGLPHPAAAPARMTMLAPVETSTQGAAAWENYRRQEYANKRLVLCGSDPAAFAEVDSFTGGDLGVRVIILPGAPWGSVIREALQACESDYVAVLNPFDCYGPHYLTDYAHATLYVTEPAIGKATFYRADNGDEPAIMEPGLEYRITDRANPWTLCLRQERAAQLAGQLADAPSAFACWSEMLRLLGHVYSSDRFNFVQRAPTDAPGACPVAESLPSELGKLQPALV
jgi:hypothetical protein